MACDFCVSVLSRALSNSKPGNHVYSHQPNFKSLTASAQHGCKLCRAFRTAALEAPSYVSLPPDYRWRPEQDETSGFVVMAHFRLTDADSGPQRAVCLQFNLALDSKVNMGSNPSFRIRSSHLSFPVQLVPQSPDFSLASRWIHQCSRSHGRCPKLEDVELPTRLTDVGRDGQDPRLVETRGQRG